MKIETKLSCGDPCYVVGENYGTGPIRELTVGQLRVEVTQSPGIEGDIDGIPAQMFSNYQAHSGYKEVVMCVETGINSGTLWEVGRNAFATREDAEAGAAALRKEHAEELQRRADYEKKRREEDIAHHRRALADLERASH